MKLTDDELQALVARYQAGEKGVYEEISKAMRGVRCRIARNYFLPGADTDDVEQELEIGLWNCLEDYNPAFGLSFVRFADTCMKRMLWTAIEQANCAKNRVLNRSLAFSGTSIPAEMDDGSDMPQMKLDTSFGKVDDPHELMERREGFEREYSALAERLNPYEKQFLAMFVAGDSYIEMARKIRKGQSLRKAIKSADNAICRVKLKAQKLLEEAS
jgi:RNA polymerase sigma-H factor